MISKYFTRPKPLPLLVTVVALVTTLALGLWQVERLEWKQKLIAEAAKAQAAPVVDLNQNSAVPVTDLIYRNVTMRGKFLHDRELHVLGRSAAGKSGYHIITPLRLHNREITVLVNRGWVPFALKEQESRPQSIAEQVVDVSGVIMRPRSKGMFTPQNAAAENVWLWYDFAAMNMATGLKLPPVVVVATAITPRSAAPDMPQLLGGEIKLRNDHLGYAVTWFMLAAGIFVIFAVYHRRPVRNSLS